MPASSITTFAEAVCSELGIPVTALPTIRAVAWRGFGRVFWVYGILRCSGLRALGIQGFKIQVSRVK